MSARSWSCLKLATCTSLVIVSAAACTPEDGTGDVLKVGLINPATGALAAFGPALENGARLALEEVNEAGGVRGKSLELVVKDSETDADVATAAAESLIDDEGVVAIIGAAGSDNSVAVAAVTSERGIPQITGASTSATLTDLDDDGYVFRTVPSDAFQGVVLADEIKGDGHDALAILHIDNAYGTGLASVIRARFEDAGGTITTAYAYPATVGDTFDFQSALSDVYATAPDAIVLVAYAADGTAFLQSWSDNGGFDGTWYLTDGMRSEDVPAAVGSAVEGITGTAPVFGAGAEYGAFSSAYETRFGDEPGIFADTYYDAMMLLALALVKAGDESGAAIRDALPLVSAPPGNATAGVGTFADAVSALEAGEDIDYVGASGDVDFDENGDVAGPVEVWRYASGAIEQDKVVAP